MNNQDMMRAAYKRSTHMMRLMITCHKALLKLKKKYLSQGLAVDIIDGELTKIVKDF
jgi:hypothetical protein